MREEKKRRKFRNRECWVGPSTISKEPSAEDSCKIFEMKAWNVREWEKRLCQHETAGLDRIDPFGINTYFIDYSLNKKKRWQLREEIAERIEDVQDQFLNVRVSASVQRFDRSNTHGQRHGLNCLEYHDVSRDGQNVIHKKSAKGRTHMRNFTDPARPKRKHGERSYRERWDWDNPSKNLPLNEKIKYQPLHIHYTTVDYSDRDSLHNKETNGHHNHKWPEAIHRSKEKYTNAIDYNECDELNADVDDVIIYEQLTVPMVVEDLASLVVCKEKRQRRRKAPQLRFMDELKKKPFSNPYVSTENLSEEEEENVEEMVSTFSTSNRLVSFPPEVARLLVSVIPNLSSLTRLPCFPPSWEIDSKDILNMIEGAATRTFTAFSYPAFIVARQYGDELRLYNTTKISSLPHLVQPEKEPPCIGRIEIDVCDICCCEMNLENEDRTSHPFSMSCGHLFCSACWLAYISQSISTLRLPVECLNPNCPCTLSFAAAKGLLSSSSLELYATLTIEALQSAGAIISCPQCKAMHYALGFRTIACLCGASICSQCSSIAHFPLPCDVNEHYTRYMRINGFSSVNAKNEESRPILRDLVKCPSCLALMQKSKGCNHMVCSCGVEFCHRCGQHWTSAHYHCTARAFTRKIALVDVFTVRSDSRLLVPSLLTRAVEARIILINRRKELRQRLQSLPPLERDRVQRAVIKLSLLLELCYLSFRRNRSSKSMVERIRFRLEAFFNTRDKNLAEKIQTLLKFNDAITT